MKSVRRVLFVDPLCPKPYSAATLSEEAMGGTEATVIRIAEELALEPDTVVEVGQHCRNYINHTSKVRYGSIYDALNAKWDVVVVLRSARLLPWIRAKQPDARIYMWLHDLAGPTLIQDTPSFEAANAVAVTVSDYHKTSCMEAMRIATPLPRVTMISNPIAPYCVPDLTPVDPNLLLFFSSPHKGLSQTLAMYSCVRRVNPQLRLEIANPGYMRFELKPTEGVTVLGSLPHQRMVQKLREALCVFHINHVHPETFGLVHAEANAVGTPVLTHQLGANHEVLNGGWQIVDTRVPKLVVDTVLRWRDDRPSVTGQERFRLYNVIKQWKSLLWK